MHVIARVEQVLHIEHVVAGFIFLINSRGRKRVKDIHRLKHQAVAPTDGLAAKTKHKVSCGIPY
ncbi:MAG: hypothetical protein OQK04_03850, partial [Kangiellaceae bacterium]|nr:hypothetical protein [Kangiellaceae bacterium]